MMNQRRFLITTSIVFLLLTAIQFKEVVIHPASLIKTHMPQDLLLSIWKISWFNHQYLTDPAELFNSNIFFPNTNTFAYSDPLLLQGFMAIPLLSITKNSILTYNLLILFTFLISGIGTALFIRYLLKEVLNYQKDNMTAFCSIFGSFIFTFFPYRFYLLQSLEHISYQWFGFIFYYMFKFYKVSKIKDLILLLCFTCLQALSSMTLFIFLSPPLLLLWVIIHIKKPSLLKFRYIWPQLAGGIILLTSLFIVYEPFWELHREQHIVRSLGSNIDHSAAISSYLSIPRTNLLHDRFAASFLKVQKRYPVFPGLSLILLGFLSLLPLRKKEPKRFNMTKVFSTIILVLLSLLIFLEIFGIKKLAFFQDADNVSTGEFHKVEQIDSTRYRWSKNEFSFSSSVPNKNKNLTIFLNIASGRPWNVPQSELKYFVQEKASGTIQIVNNDFTSYQIIVPKENLNGGKINLRFVIDTWNPKSSKISQDDRNLGLMLNFIGMTQSKIIPCSWYLPEKVRNFLEDWGISFIFGLWLMFILKFSTGLSIFQRYFVCLTLLGFILSLGPVLFQNGNSLWKGPYYVFYEYFPGFKALRAPYRTVVLSLLGAAILGSVGLYRLLDFIKKKRSRIFAAGACSLFALFEYYNSNVTVLPPSEPLHQNLPAVYQWLQKQDGEFGIIELPISQTPSRDAEFMYWSTFHWKNLVNGYSGYIPKSYYPFLKVYDQIPNSWFYNKLKEIDIKYIIYHSNKDPKKQYQPLLNIGGDYEIVKQFESDYVLRIRSRKSSQTVS